MANQLEQQCLQVIAGCCLLVVLMSLVSLVAPVSLVIPGRACHMLPWAARCSTSEEENATKVIHQEMDEEACQGRESVKVRRAGDEHMELDPAS